MLRKSLAVFFAVAVAVTANSAVQLQRGKPDGYKTVAHAQWLGSSGKLEEGRAFIAELRARPLEGRTVEEIEAALRNAGRADEITDFRKSILGRFGSAEDVAEALLAPEVAEVPH